MQLKGKNNFHCKSINCASIIFCILNPTQQCHHIFHDYQKNNNKLISVFSRWCLEDCVCVWECFGVREREFESLCVYVMRESVYLGRLCVCVCVWVWERERNQANLNWDKDKDTWRWQYELNQVLVKTYSHLMLHLPKKKIFPTVYPTWKFYSKSAKQT